MARYRLVMTNGDEIITGEELQSILVAMNFDVPNIAPATKLVLPRWTGGRKQSKDPLFIQWGIDCAVVKAAYDADFARWQDEVSDVAAWLEGMFVIATEVIIGLNENGTKKRELQIISPAGYKFSQAAQKLTGATKPVDEIEFICNGYFG
jgi:hypothetical protein